MGANPAVMSIARRTRTREWVARISDSEARGGDKPCPQPERANKLLDPAADAARVRLPAALSDLLLRLSPWLLPIAAVAGMWELIGGGWDIQWHIAHVPEVFWTPPHIVLYSG